MSLDRVESQSTNLAPPYPTLGEATAVWAKIGLLSFGGPAGQIALMHKELVEERRWISEGRFLHALNFCMLLPGPEAQQLATYIGWLLHGTRGGVIAGVLFVIPGFVVIVALSMAYTLFHQAALVTSLFFGLKAAVLAIVIEAVVRVARRALKNGAMVGIAVAAFAALFAFDLPFPVVVLGAAIVGYVGSQAHPALFKSAGHRAGTTDGPAVIDEGFVEQPPTLWRSLRVLVVWGALWIAPLIVIVPLLGGASVFTTIWLFFSEMAVVTFGGAYAVLAYVAQVAVQHFGWLQPGEMVDGLALAETTPGPLVMVLSFVGFLAAIRANTGMDPLLAGFLGAALTTWVTFVPCFLWIFLGAPYIERLRSNQRLSGALAAITAAVVGVILNLAIWFGLHVIFKTVGRITLGPLSLAWPDWPSINPSALALAVVASAALFGFHLGMFRTLLLCGALGLAVGALGWA